MWRDSASGCGLILPPLPESRPGLWPEGVSSEEQWQVASEHWEEVTSLWERRYDSGQESGDNIVIVSTYNKATQTQLLVSRLLPAKRGCVRAVIIHYFVISYDTMNTCTEQTRDVI